MGRGISFKPGHVHYNRPAQEAQDHPESSVAGSSSAGPGALAAEAAVTGEPAAQWNENRSGLPATAPVAMSSLQFQLLHQMHAEAGPSTGLRPADMQTETTFLAHDAASHRGGEPDDDLLHLLNDPQSESRLAEMAAFVADSPSPAQMAPAAEPLSGETVFSPAKAIEEYKATLRKNGRSSGGVSAYVDGLKHIAQWLESEKEKGHEIPHGLDSLEKLGRHQNQDHVKKVLESFKESDSAKAVPSYVRKQIRAAFAAFQQALWPEIHPPKSQLTPEEDQLIRAYMAIAQEEGSHKKRTPVTVLQDATRLKHLAHWLRESASVPYGLNSLEKLGRHLNDQEVNEVLKGFTQSTAVPPRIKKAISNIVGVLRCIWFGIEAKLAAGHRGSEPDDDLSYLLNDPQSESRLAEMAAFVADSPPLALAAEPPSGETVFSPAKAIAEYKAALQKNGMSAGAVSHYVASLKHFAKWLESEKEKGHEIPHGLDSLEKLGRHQNQDHVKKVLESFKESDSAKAVPSYVRKQIRAAFAAFQQALWPEIHPPKMQLPPEEDQLISAYMAIAQGEGSHKKRAPRTVLHDAAHLKHLAQWLRESASIPYGLNSLEKLGRHRNDQEVNEVLASFKQSAAVPPWIKRPISGIVDVLRWIWFRIEATLEKEKQAATDLDTTDLELDQFAADLEVDLDTTDFELNQFAADLDAAFSPSETATGWADPASSSLAQSGTTRPHAHPSSSASAAPAPGASARPEPAAWQPRLPGHALGETSHVAQPGSLKRAAPELPAESRVVRARPTVSSLPEAPRPPQTALQQRLLSQASRVGPPSSPAPSRRGTADEDEN